MDNLKRDNPSEEEMREQELLELLADTIEEEPGSVDTSKCPSLDELRLLDRGVSHARSQRASLLVHLADCNHCIQVMKHIRENRIRANRILEDQIRQRRVFAQRAMVTASVLVVAVIIFIWARYAAPVSPNLVTTIDLRVPYTRGNENSSVPPRAQLRRPMARFRIVLPFGTDGSYEAIIVPAESHETVVARSAGYTQIENHSVVLYLSADVSALEPGDYSLALRRSGSEWEYYPLTVQ
jgi:hypothetical protein